MATAGVDVYWIPLGAGVGGTVVRWSGRIYELMAARLAARPRYDLYHSALEITLDGRVTVVEMAPVWLRSGDRGVVAEGPVGAPLLGRSRLFRYEVRCWRHGSIPDAAAAVGGPCRVSSERTKAEAVLDLVPRCPILTWGRDERRTGDMWNSNSLVSWVLSQAGLMAPDLGPPPGGRAPGWAAGLAVAADGPR